MRKIPGLFEADQHGTWDIASINIHVENGNARFALPYFSSAVLLIYLGTLKYCDKQQQNHLGTAVVDFGLHYHIRSILTLSFLVTTSTERHLLANDSVD